MHSFSTQGDCKIVHGAATNGYKVNFHPLRFNNV
jgi:hypothetical protein